MNKLTTIYLGEAVVIKVTSGAGDMISSNTGDMITCGTGNKRLRRYIKIRELSFPQTAPNCCGKKLGRATNSQYCSVSSVLGLGYLKGDLHRRTEVKGRGEAAQKPLRRGDQIKAMTAGKRAQRRVVECVERTFERWGSGLFIDGVMGRVRGSRCYPRKDKFGIPKVIISDNARQFDNDRFRLFCSDLAISHHFSSPGHPQANGQVKVTNRTILRNLKARLERSKSEWADDLPSILWAYHTTSRIPAGETPYSMVFGTKSVIPVEIGMPSFRTLNFDKNGNEGELRLNLDLLDEKREIAELRQATYKNRIAKYYNERVKHRSFLPGDLVLRRVTLSTRDPSAGKLGSTWEGPYKVIKVSRPGTYWLEDPNGRALLHPWNAEHLKKYYQ
ncbi:hypothetical protein Acr_11g0011320 [Actinidia rufa]|uniref:Integrase catalytic domain-containing protein n=1 Tax=Actinidia rufa TaxID=165716 RepID=A0A7J0FEH3_9ERIC|nr:hypothetical protein Acr_11g0011320 [Actinidia rufa]